MALVSLPFGIAVGACLALVSAGDAGCMLQHRAGDPQKNQAYSFSMDRLAYRSDCQLGSSYTSGCKTRAVMELKPCEATSREDPQELSACIQELEWPQANDFSQKIKNQETQEEAMTKAVEATGGGWGLQVSASVDFMSQSTSASTSVSFQIAQARQVRKSFIEHGRTLTLAPEARKLLEQNPWEFLNVYGGYFVQSIIHGGSFVGTATVRSLETGSSQSLGAYADLQFSGTMGFSADFKSVFEETKKDTSSFTDVQTDFQQLGGILDAQDAEVKDSEQLDALNQRFEKWSETVSKAPQQLLMSLQPWMAIGEVHEILQNFNSSIRNLFYHQTSDQVVGSLTKETWFVESLKEDADSLQNRRLQARCGTHSATAWEKRYLDLKDALTQHQMKLDMLKHGDVMDIQAEMQKGNWSFFSASRPDGILNQKFTQLLVACEVVSVMYNGLSSATMSQPQSLKFHQSLLPAKYEGSFWMTGLKVWLGDHCNGGWRPRGFKHAQLLGLTVLGEANSEEEPSNKSINLQVPQEGAALCPPRTFAFGLEVSFFDAGDKWWSEIVSEDECKEDGAMMETLQVFCKSLPLGHYSDPVQRASSRKVFIENPKANATRSAMCPENTFISHVAITPKGTCFHHCDEDGAIVQSISLECHPVCNFNQNVSCPRAAA